MCWLMAFIRTGGKVGKAPRHLEETIKKNLPRGNHAWGFASIGDNGRITSFKEPGVIDHKIVLDAARKARIMIVHGRWATHGSARDNHNNHPHACDGGWIAHNGVIGTHEAIARAHGLLLQTECDSEVLARLVESADGSITERVKHAVDQTSVYDALCMLGLWNRISPTLVAVRRGNPLHYWQEGRFTWFATLAPESAGSAYLVEDNTIYTCGLEGGVRKHTPTDKKFREWNYQGNLVSDYSDCIRDPSGAIIINSAPSKTTSGAISTQPPMMQQNAIAKTRQSYGTTNYNDSKLPLRYRSGRGYLARDWMKEKVGSATNRLRKTAKQPQAIKPSDRLSTLQIAEDTGELIEETEDKGSRDAKDIRQLSDEEYEEIRDKMQRQQAEAYIGNKLTDEEWNDWKEQLLCDEEGFH